jgi:hypothetical protein
MRRHCYVEHKVTPADWCPVGELAALATEAVGAPHRGGGLGGAAGFAAVLAYTRPTDMGG